MVVHAIIGQCTSSCAKDRKGGRYRGHFSDTLRRPCGHPHRDAEMLMIHTRLKNSAKRLGDTVPDTYVQATPPTWMRNLTETFVCLR